MCMHIEGSNELGEAALVVRVEAIPRGLVQTTNQCWVGRCRATPKTACPKVEPRGTYFGNALLQAHSLASIKHLAEIFELPFPPWYLAGTLQVSKKNKQKQCRACILENKMPPSVSVWFSKMPHGLLHSVTGCANTPGIYFCLVLYIFEWNLGI
jgi:hypothetical protein